MAKNTRRIAGLLDAEIVGEVPLAGGGAFGAARLARVVAELRENLKPGKGRRPGRPTRHDWDQHPKVPMKKATKVKLERLARRASRKGAKVSPMQVAAELLEKIVAACPDE